MITEQMIIEAAKAHFLMPQNDDQLGIYASTLGSFAKYFYRKGLTDAAEKCASLASSHREDAEGDCGYYCDIAVTFDSSAEQILEMAQEVK